MSDSQFPHQPETHQPEAHQPEPPQPRHDEELPMTTQQMPTTTTPQQERGLHPVNTGHLVMGVAFAGLVVIWALITANAVADDDVRWLLPIPWVVAGAVGLVVATTGSFRRTPAPHPASTGPTPTDDIEHTEEIR